MNEHQMYAGALALKFAETLGACAKTLPADNTHRVYAQFAADNPPLEVLEHIVEPGKHLQSAPSQLKEVTTAVFVVYEGQVYAFMALLHKDTYTILPARMDADDGKFAILPWRYVVRGDSVSPCGMLEADQMPEGVTMEMVKDIYSLARAGIEHGESLLRAPA